MCEYCHQSVCPGGCPNYDWESHIVFYCDNCDAEIFDGDDYAEMPNGERWCKSCYLDIPIKTAEKGCFEDEE